MWSNFNYSFTFAFSGKLRKRYVQTIPPQLITVATLPCDVWIFNLNVRLCLFTEVVAYKKFLLFYSEYFTVSIYHGSYKFVHVFE